MSFSIPDEYTVVPKSFPLKDFVDYKDNYLTRPPYQRKPVAWEPKRKIAFLDSLCKGYYIPKIVLRRIKLGPNTKQYEVIDGQQRINTIQEFYADKLALPKTLSTSPGGDILVGRKYAELGPTQRQWFDKDLSLAADLITNIDDPTNPEHSKKAAEIFWRLQQGVSLNFIETLHSRLYSGAGRFITKHADDASFDFQKYDFVAENKDRHPFFGKVLAMNNDHMQHLGLLGRLLLIEFEDGPTD